LQISLADITFTWTRDIVHANAARFSQEVGVQPNLEAELKHAAADTHNGSFDSREQSPEPITLDEEMINQWIDDTPWVEHDTPRIDDGTLLVDENAPLMNLSTPLMEARDAIPRSRFRPYSGGANQDEMAAVVFDTQEIKFDTLPLVNGLQALPQFHAISNLKHRTHRYHAWRLLCIRGRHEE
jgi:hypothetical protein